jgi:hypothetical protein
MVLVLIIGASATFLLLRWLARTKGLSLRRLPALDVLEEIIGRCTEMGRPLITFGGVSFQPAGLSTLSINTYAAGLCAKSKMRIYSVLYNPNLIAITSEIYRVEYASAGVGDMYDPIDQVRFYGNTPSSKYASGVAQAVDELNPGGAISLPWGEAAGGPATGITLMCNEAVARAGIMIISGCPRLSSLLPAAITSDYLLIGEEIYAAGAYLSKDPILIGTLAAQDIFRVIFSVLLILSLILTATGSKFLIDLMKI